MVACSSHITEKMKNEAILTGFDIVYESPLTSTKMKEIILYIEERKSLIKSVAENESNELRSFS